MRNQGPPGLQRTEGKRAVIGGLVLAAACVGVYVHMRSGKAVSRQAVGPAAEMRRELRAEREVSPGLLKWREAAQIETGVRQPRGICAHGADGVCVVGDEALRVFDAQGSLVHEVALRGPPNCVAADDVDASGAIYVALRDHVVRCDLAQESQDAWPSFGPTAYVTGIAVSGDEVWVADAGARVILRCGKSGSVLGRVGEKDEGRGIPGLVAPSPRLDVAAGPEGLLLVNNPGRHSVESYTVDGDLAFSWGKPSQSIDGFCGCCNPTNIAAGADGRVVVAEKGLARVKVCERDGVVESVVAGPEDLSAGVVGLDLAVDGRGRVLVLDPPACVVRVFERVGG